MVSCQIMAEQGAAIRELASGVDALYLSGQASLPETLLAHIEAARAEAEVAGGAVAIDFGGEAVRLAPHAWGKYRYCLTHPYGRIGLTGSKNLPAIRIQPRAEFLHGAGAAGVVNWFRDVVESECGPVLLTVSRLDIHADFQGWNLHGDDRGRFVCRGTARTTYEDVEYFNGLEFGKRESGTVTARIYDKTVEVEKKGSAYWKDIWGSAYEPSLSVLRVEFEIGRGALRQYRLNAPEEVLAAVGALWADLTSSWLSYRIPTDDCTKSRWPVSPEWQAVRRARLAEDAYGIKRMYDGRRRGELERLVRGLTGFLSSVAAVSNGGSLEETLGTTRWLVRSYERRSGPSFEDRTAEKRREYGFP
jgi:hypothetical protein